MELKEIIAGMEEVGIRGAAAGLFDRKLLGFPDGSGRILVCIGFIPLPDPRPPPPGAVGRLAPFAARHHYRRIVAALRPLSRRIREEHRLPKAAFRLFSNSSLPERSLAAALRLGWVGRHGLLMNGAYGSAFLLAGLAVDLEAADPAPGGIYSLTSYSSLAPPADLFLRCGTCRACLEACPVGAIGAIDPEGGVDPDRCLQQISTRPGPLPEGARRVWGRRIYGCQICQQVCPVNRGRTVQAELLADGLEQRPLTPLLKGFAEGRPVKELLPDTALEASWVPREAILRNLLIAAGESGTASLSPLIKAFLDHPDEGVRQEAERSLGILGRL